MLMHAVSTIKQVVKRKGTPIILSGVQRRESSHHLKREVKLQREPQKRRTNMFVLLMVAQIMLSKELDMGQKSRSNDAAVKGAQIML